MSERKTLAVRVAHGLCNRLRTLLCAMAYCELTERRLLVQWSRRSKYRFSFSDLFESPPFDLISWTRWNYLRLRNGGHIEANEMSVDMADPLICLRTTSVFCEDDFPRPYIESLDRLTPLPSVLEAVATARAEWDPDSRIVGLNVRTQAASSDSREHASPDWFVGRMQQIHERWPDVQFFVSGDTEATVQRLRGATNARVHSLPKTYEYNRPRGVREGLADLYLLASTDYFLADYGSSFSAMACQMGGPVPHEISSTERSDDDLARLLEV